MDDKLQTAKNFCEKNGYRFTEPRKIILQTILNETKHLTAYDILEILSKDKSVKPPTVYRAIDFWLKHDFIHRVESLNAYIICKEHHNHKGFEVFVCEKCNYVDESHFCNSQILKELQQLTQYKVQSWNIELKGICQKCMNSIEN